MQALLLLCSMEDGMVMLGAVALLNQQHSLTRVATHGRKSRQQKW
jgi:hypothetical protein